MIYRHATIKDIRRDDWREMVLRGLDEQKVGMVHSWEKIESLALQSLVNGFWMVAEKENVIVAHLGAIVTENSFFEGEQCIVVAWYSEYPGAGWRLFRLFNGWLENADVKSAAIATNMDDRLTRILKRRGWMMCPQYLKPIKQD